MLAAPRRRTAFRRSSTLSQTLLDHRGDGWRGVPLPRMTIKSHAPNLDTIAATTPATRNVAICNGRAFLPRLCVGAFHASHSPFKHCLCRQSWLTESAGPLNSRPVAGLPSPVLATPTKNASKNHVGGTSCSLFPGHGRPALLGFDDSRCARLGAC